MVGRPGRRRESNAADADEPDADDGNNHIWRDDLFVPLLQPMPALRPAVRRVSVLSVPALSVLAVSVVGNDNHNLLSGAAIAAYNRMWVEAGNKIAA